MVSPENFNQPLPTDTQFPEHGPYIPAESFFDLVTNHLVDRLSNHPDAQVLAEYRNAIVPTEQGKPPFGRFMSAGALTSDKPFHLAHGAIVGVALPNADPIFTGILHGTVEGVEGRYKLKVGAIPARKLAENFVPNSLLDLASLVNDGNGNSNHTFELNIDYGLADEKDGLAIYKYYPSARSVLDHHLLVDVERGASRLRHIEGVIGRALNMRPQIVSTPQGQVVRPDGKLSSSHISLVLQEAAFIMDRAAHDSYQGFKLARIKQKIYLIRNDPWCTF